MWVTSAIAAIALGGCGCVSWNDANAADKELSRQSDVHRVQAIERAAAELGAVLLEGEMVSLPPECLGYAQGSVYRRVDCVRSEQVDERVWRLWTSRGETKLALVLDRFNLHRGERLARKEATLFVLTPTVVMRKVDEGTRCECDAMPRAYPDETVAIVVDDAPIRKVVEFGVSFRHDFIDWECRVRLL